MERSFFWRQIANRHTPSRIFQQNQKLQSEELFIDSISFNKYKLSPNITLTFTFCFEIYFLRKTSENEMKVLVPIERQNDFKFINKLRFKKHSFKSKCKIRQCKNIRLQIDSQPLLT